MPMGSDAVLEMPGAPGLWPCGWTHHKKRPCATFMQYNIYQDNKVMMSRSLDIITLLYKLLRLSRDLGIIYIIIIMSCRQHGYPWPSLATSPNYSSPPAGLQGYILCPHIVAVCKFELVVLLLHGHMWGSIGVHHLWARPCFSSSVPRVWFV